MRGCSKPWLLALILIVPAEARERTPQEQAKKVTPGSRIHVHLKTGRLVGGRLGEITETQFSLEPQNPGGGSATTYLFQDVSEIRSAEPKPVWIRTLEAFVIIPFRVIETIGAVVYCTATVWFGSCDE
jgi:hypothetical protein